MSSDLSKMKIDFLTEDVDEQYQNFMSCPARPSSKRERSPNPQSRRSPTPELCPELKRRRVKERELTEQIKELEKEFKECDEDGKLAWSFVHKLKHLVDLLNQYRVAVSPWPVTVTQEELMHLKSEIKKTEEVLPEVADYI